MSRLKSSKRNIDPEEKNSKHTNQVDHNKKRTNLQISPIHLNYILQNGRSHIFRINLIYFDSSLQVIHIFTPYQQPFLFKIKGLKRKIPKAKVIIAHLSHINSASMYLIYTRSGVASLKTKQNMATLVLNCNYLKLNFLIYIFSGTIFFLFFFSHKVVRERSIAIGGTAML